MKRLIGRNLGMALLLAFGVTGMAVRPAVAQEQTQTGDRIVILTPDLAPRDGAKDKFGKKVAEELRDRIGELHTHETVSGKELKNARKKYDLSEEDLYNCISSRQLAMQMGWGLVLCGEYKPAGDGQYQVSAKFVGAQDGETFEVPPFVAQEKDPKQAADQILQTFDKWQTQLRHTVFCQQYMDSQQWDAALENCDKALAINPESKSALYKKAFTLWKMDRREDALQTLDKVLEMDPINQDALKLAGIVATEMNNREKARQYFDRYMELNPGDVGVRLQIATDISNAGDYEGALHFAEEGMKVDSTNMNLITYIGHFAANAAAKAEQQMQESQGDGSVDAAHITDLYRTAANAYQKVFAANGPETDPQILERLIVAEFKLGNYDQAVKLGAQAVEAQPDNAPIWDAYSRALEEAGQTDQAMAAINKVEELGGSSPALVQRKAMIQFKQGDATDAVQTLKQAVEAGQFDPSAAFNTVFAYAYKEKMQKGQPDAAYDLLDAAGPLAVNETDKLTRNFWRGYILYQQGQKVAKPMDAASAAKAKPLFERALELFQAARGYEKIHSSADVPKLIDATQRFIEIQEALIKRGR